MKKQERKNNFFDELMSGLNDALSHARGDKKLKMTTVKIHPVQDMTAKDITKLREKLSLSQGIFAQILGVSRKTVESWEYGKSHPNGTALRLMDLLGSEKDLIDKKYIEKEIA